MERIIEKKKLTKKQITLIVSGCTIVFYLYFVIAFITCFNNIHYI